MDVSAFLADRVELVEEQYAWRRTRIFEEAREPRIGLAEIGADQGVVTHRKQRNGNGLRDGFSD